MSTRFILYLALLSAITITSTHATEPKPGESFGAKKTEIPHWFKDSFLEFEDDIAEATDENKRVMLYFHQDGCPYCARLVDENFGDPVIEAYIKKHFDGITLNIVGDREVISIAGQSFTEKTFSAALNVQYTPTLIFLNESGKVALRLNGYYPPDEFRAALNYVAEKHELKYNFSSYIAQNSKPVNNDLIPEDFYNHSSQLSGLIGQDKPPLAVYFESGSCDECSTLHERILTDKTTRDLVTSMTNVQFDIHSNKTITTPDGRQTTVAKWAQQLNIGYTPSVVFFNAKGAEVMRIDAFLKTFHFQSVYDYVLTKAYITQPRFQRFISKRADKIREAGFNTDIWGYESSH
ncbi:MAG: thioredoxin-related protein [Polaribacter sp.]|jgi:thioredoxin-related protein